MKSLRLVILATTLLLGPLAFANSETVNCAHAKVYGEGEREPTNYNERVFNALNKRTKNKPADNMVIPKAKARPTR